MEASVLTLLDMFASFVISRDLDLDQDASPSEDALVAPSEGLFGLTIAHEGLLPGEDSL
jgi:hypothetical protein